jgi:alkylated DNA repair dioxygenase AlkB
MTKRTLEETTAPATQPPAGLPGRETTGREKAFGSPGLGYVTKKVCLPVYAEGSTATADARRPYRGVVGRAQSLMELRLTGPSLTKRGIGQYNQLHGTADLTGQSSVSVIHDFLPRDVAASLLMKFKSDTFRSLLSRPMINTPGGKKPIPRGQVAFGSGVYRYSGLKVAALPWDTIPEVAHLRTFLEEVCEQRIDYVLVNEYSSGLDSIDWHGDDERDLETGAAIMSFSVGATRRFRMRSTDKKINVEFPASHNTLLVMRGACQEEFKHQVPKERGITESRFNLTFRTMRPRPDGRVAA